MQKIGDITGTANPAGEFTEGNPGAGADATLLKSGWLNTIQRELINLIIGAGILLDKNDDAQVLGAVKSLAGTAADFDKLKNKPTTLDGYSITDAIKKGQFGLGASDLTESGSDAIGRPGGFYFFGESANTFAQYASVLNLPYGASNSAQLAIRQGAAKASAAIRSVNAQGGWTPTAEIWTDANFNPNSKADRGTTLGAYGISDAYTKAQTDTAIASATSGKANNATTLGGYGITDAYTRAQTDSAIASAVSGKANNATTLGGYGITDAYTREHVNSMLGGKLDKSGGTIDGSLYVASPQSLSSPAFSVNSDTPGSALSAMRIRCRDTGVLLTHTNGTDALSVITAAGTAATISVGQVLAAGSPCHTAASFMKPVAGQWISLTGGATLPAGGTWAYQVSTFNNTGTLIAGSTAGLAAGGTQLGHATSIGFAWRIQ